MRSTRAIPVRLLLVLSLAAVLSGCTPRALAPSGPEEAVLRGLRLAGFERMAVAESDGVAYVSLEMPGIDSAADVELAWQIAVAEAHAAFPDADLYAVTLCSEDQALLGVLVSSQSAAEAIAADDGDALRAACTFEYLPAIDAQDAAFADAGVGVEKRAAEELGPDYLDAKNRAAGLTFETDRGVIGAACEAATAMRADTTGRPAIEPGRELESYAGLIAESLNGSADGEEAVVEQMDSWFDDPASADVVRAARAFSFVVEAVSRDASHGSALAAADVVASAVADTRLGSGAAADAVLVAAGDPKAPEDARVVSRFERYPETDIHAGEPNPGSAIWSALDAYDGVWFDEDGVANRFDSQDWLGYRRSDGSVYVRGDVDDSKALVDATVDGWAFAPVVIAVVDANDVGARLGTLVTSGVSSESEE